MRHARLAEELTKLATDHGHTMAVTDLLDAASIIHSVPQKMSELARLQAELAAARERVACLYTGMRRVVVAAGGVAEDGVSDEFLLGAADEVSALREERDRLRAEADRIEKEARHV